jgi:hypothetical protein
VRIILEAQNIPVGSLVTKITGTMIYTIYDSIIVYNEKGEKNKISSVDGSRYLVGKQGNTIGSVSANTELIWITTDEEAYAYLSSILEAE